MRKILIIHVVANISMLILICLNLKADYTMALLNSFMMYEFIYKKNK